VRAVASVALQLVRAVEETLLKGATHNLIVRSRSDVAIYVLNHKRAHLRMLEERFKISIAVNVDSTLTGHPSFAIDRGELVMSIDQAKAIAANIKPDSIAAYEEGDDIEETEDEVLDELETEGEEATAEAGGEESRERSGRKRRRRGRRGRGGRDGEPREANGAPLGHSQDEATALAEGEEPAEIGDAESLEETEAEDASGNGDGDKRRRRRGRRGGRRNRRGREGNGEDAGHGDAGLGDAQEAPFAASQDDDDSEPSGAEAAVVVEPERPAEPVVAAAPRASERAPEPVEEAPARKRSTVREAPPVYSSAETPAPAYVPAEPVTPPSPEPVTAEAEEKPRKKGWWSRG
jgi:ribonuclease E